MAQVTLGNMYFDGNGVVQNDKTGVKWYTLADEQGLSGAQVYLGDRYLLGEGVIQDYKTAVK